ncbi:MAG: hypothetical protein NT031_07915 [Planctomycetota bacterium]|nr:hypothetical protein [Planctomycetota bacterium]
MATTGRLVRAAGVVMGLAQAAMAAGPVVEAQPPVKLGAAWWIVTILAVAIAALAGAAAVRIVKGIRQRER